jgi:hypothetical protein
MVESNAFPAWSISVLVSGARLLAALTNGKKAPSFRDLPVLLVEQDQQSRQSSRGNRQPSCEQRMQ